jgi:hypothetical protein
MFLVARIVVGAGVSVPLSHPVSLAAPGQMRKQRR